jgi:hypothetical protein
MPYCLPNIRLRIEYLVMIRMHKSLNLHSPLAGAFKVCCRSFSESRSHSLVSAPTIHQTITGRKRFYKHVSIELANHDINDIKLHDWLHEMKISADRPLYRILLDGKALKTPGEIRAYSQAIAVLILCL